MRARRWGAVLSIFTLGLCVSVAAQGAEQRHVLWVPIPGSGGGGAPAELDRICWVEVNHYQDAAQAEAVRAELTAAGYSPVSIVPTPEGLSVRVGEFAIYADAYLLSEDMRIDSPGARIVEASLAEEHAAGRDWEFRPLTAPPGARAIFNLAERPLVTEEPLHFTNEAAAIRDGGQLFDPADPRGDREIEEQAVSLTDLAKDPRDPARGLAYFVIADVRASRGELQNALDLALRVANESLQATPQKRYEAMWLVARLHHAMDERMTAYRAYKEIEGVINDPRDLARCLVEQAGLLIELVRHHSTGRVADARLLCNAIVEEMGDQTDPEIRGRVATADLMQGETWLYDGDPQRCLEECRRVASEYADIKREASMALIYCACALDQMGRLQEARSTLETVVQMDLGPGDSFPNQDHTQMALTRLGSVCGRMGDTAAAQRYCEMAVTRPDPRSQVSHTWNQEWGARGTPPR